MLMLTIYVLFVDDIKVMTTTKDVGKSFINFLACHYL